MQSSRSFFSRADLLGITIAVAIVLAFFMYLQHETVSAELQLEVTTDRAGTLQIFWRADEAGYTENHSRSARLEVGQLNKLSLPIAGINRINRLRIDPLENLGHLTLQKAVLHSPWIKDYDLLATILPTNLLDIQGMNLTRTDTAVKLTATAIDPFFEIGFTRNITISYRPNVLLGGGFLVIVVLSVVINRRFLKGDERAGVLQVSLSVTDGQDCWSLPFAQLFRAGQAMPKVSRKLAKGKLTYTATFAHITPGDLLPIIAEIRQQQPQAIVHFQYNRAGEA